MGRYVESVKKSDVERQGGYYRGAVIDSWS